MFKLIYFFSFAFLLETLAFGAFIKKPKKSDLGDVLINGEEVTEGFDEVVMLRMGGSLCTGTLIGPKVVITAAHCVDTGEQASFKVGNSSYTGVGYRSPKYPGVDHDVAIVTLKEPIKENIKFASIGGKARRGSKILLLGYGCTDIGGQGGVDGKKRKGESVIIGYSGYDMVSRMRGGAALCFGDSGGPAFQYEGDNRYLLGVNSKGNIRDTNYNLRTDSTATREFLSQRAAAMDLEMCGVTMDCIKKEDPKPDPKPNDCKKVFQELKQCLKY